MPQHRRRIAGLERGEESGDGREHRSGLCSLGSRRIGRFTRGLRGGGSRKKQRGCEHDGTERRDDTLRLA